MKSQLRSGCGCTAALEQVNRVNEPSTPFDQQARYSNRSAQARRRGDAGNSLGTARKIPGTVGSREFRDSVSSVDADFYRFQLKKPMSVRIKAANLFGDTLAFTVTRQGGAIFAQNPAISAGQQNRDSTGSKLVCVL